MREKLHARKGFYRLEEGGWEYPEYPKLAGLAGFRAKAKAGLKALDREEVHAYGAAVEAAIRALQLRGLRGAVAKADPVEPIGDARLARFAAALHACPALERRRRKPRVWREMYEAAMAEKHEMKRAA